MDSYVIKVDLTSEQWGILLWLLILLYVKFGFKI